VRINPAFGDFGIETHPFAGRLFPAANFSFTTLGSLQNTKSEGKENENSQSLGNELVEGRLFGSFIIICHDRKKICTFLCVLMEELVAG